MGMVAPACELLFFENAYRKITGDVLFIGRQDIFLTKNALEDLLRRYGVPPRGEAFIEMSTTRPQLISDKSLMSFFDIRSLSFMDVSDYEGANIVWDLGYPVDEGFHNKFDFIFNGSCLDNMFNPAGAMMSISKMLKPGGRVLHLEHASHYNGPYVMFPPSWFFDYYVQNGFADSKVYVGEFDQDPHLYYGPWNLSFHDYVHNPNGFVPAGKNLMLLAIAEKKADSTTERQPIQAQYRRNEASLEMYNRNVQVVDSSQRPIFGIGAKRNPGRAALIPLGPVSDLYKGIYPQG